MLKRSDERLWQSGRSNAEGLGFLRRAMKRYGPPKSIVTDRLSSYRAAMTMIGNAANQACGRWLNNRAENSHQSFRRREGAIALGINQANAMSVGDVLSDAVL